MRRIKFILFELTEGQGLEFITLFFDKNGSSCLIILSAVLGLCFSFPSSLYVILLNSPLYRVKYPLLGLKLNSCFI